MALQSFVRLILPREDQFFVLLESLAKLCKHASVALVRFREPTATVEQIRKEVQELEHQADALVQQLEDALARTFVTPLDREDLHLLGSELDDVIDLTNLAARACELYGVQRPTEAMIQLMELLVKCTEVVEVAVPKLRAHQYTQLIEDGRVIRGLEKQADQVFRKAVSQLFHDDGVDAKTLVKHKEVLEDIERAVDRCDELADTLSNIAVKHG